MPKGSLGLSDYKAQSHGAINEEEVAEHRHKLDKMVEDLKESAMEKDIREIMGDFITAVKLCCTEVYAPMASADAQKVLHLMRDTYGLALW